MVVFIGKDVHIIGKRLAVGDMAPDFHLPAPTLEKKSLADFAGKKKIISIVPSIDTGVCSAQTRRFNEAVSSREDAVVITVSVDLPFAQERWCGAEGLPNAITLSDYYDNAFGRAYGVLMEEWHLLARAVLVLDEDNRVLYTEYLEDTHAYPDYEKALSALG